MRWGLREKLWGLVLLSVLITLLGAVMVGQRLMQVEVSRYVSERHRELAQSLVPMLAAYYQEHAGWTGVRGPEGILPQPGPRPQPPPALSPSSLALRLHPILQRNRVIVADAEGRVLVDSLGRLGGTTLTGAERAKSAPVAVEGWTVGYVLVGAKSSVEAQSFEEFFRARLSAILLGSGLLAALVALLLGAGFASRLLRPLRSMQRVARRIASGKLEARVPVERRDELGELASALNAMAAQLEEAQKLRKQMVADIAHELRTPLAVILGNLEAMAEGVIPLRPERVTSLHGEALVLTRLVEDLRTLSLAEAQELSLKVEKIDLKPWIEALKGSLRSQLGAKALRLALDVPANLSVRADPQRLRQVLLNLVTNAIQHTPERGQVAIRARARQGAARIEVSDTGEGIPLEELPHLFDRFYRGKRSRLRPGSTGLGLAIAKALAEAQGGRIWAQSEPGRGTTFSLTLPLEASGGQGAEESPARRS